MAQARHRRHLPCPSLSSSYPVQCDAEATVRNMTRTRDEWEPLGTSVAGLSAYLFGRLCSGVVVIIARCGRCRWRCGAVVFGCESLGFGLPIVVLILLFLGRHRSAPSANAPSSTFSSLECAKFASVVVVASSHSLKKHCIRA